jgi:hypothetical protein
MLRSTTAFASATAADEELGRSIHAVIVQFRGAEQAEKGDGPTGQLQTIVPWKPR